MAMGRKTHTQTILRLQAYTGYSILVIDQHSLPSAGSESSQAVLYFMVLQPSNKCSLNSKPHKIVIPHTTIIAPPWSRTVKNQNVCVCLSTISKILRCNKLYPTPPETYIKSWSVNVQLITFLCQKAIRKFHWIKKAHVSLLKYAEHFLSWNILSLQCDNLATNILTHRLFAPL